jgi:hypothetical protein
MTPTQHNLLIANRNGLLSQIQDLRKQQQKDHKRVQRFSRLALEVKTEMDSRQRIINDLQTALERVQAHVETIEFERVA